MPLEVVMCPECGLVAEVTGHDWLASTAGPVEHLHLQCVQRHWFLLPAEDVTGGCAGLTSGDEGRSRLRG